MTTLRRGATALTLSALLALTACGGGNDSPFGDPNAPAPTAPTTSPAEATTDSTRPSTPSAPLEPLPTTPAQGPSPTGTTPTSIPDGKTPSQLSADERIAADQTAMLNARTMVSVIEGCHSGSDSYRNCNSHEELGDPKTLGLQIGKKLGEVQISATENGFRVTARSRSGAKFTVARGPKGDRFKCLPGPKPGACPNDRSWSW